VVTKSNPLLYLQTMFATCMLFQTIYVACIALWIVFPDLKGHALLTDIFPQFQLLDVVSFIFGLIMSAIYAWFVAVIFVFFFNLWPHFAHLIWGKRAAL
jgi:hypothetical protein